MRFSLKDQTDVYPAVRGAAPRMVGLPVRATVANHTLAALGSS